MKTPNIHGSMSLEIYNGTVVPMDRWDIVAVYDNILMGEFVDEKEEVTEHGIVLPIDFMKHSWRIIKVIMVGQNSTSGVKAGDLVMVPSDKGIPQIQSRGAVTKTFLFINEDLIFCKVMPKVVAADKPAKKSKK